jgi:hypothetical protein
VPSIDGGVPSARKVTVNPVLLRLSKRRDVAVALAPFVGLIIHTSFPLSITILRKFFGMGFKKERQD